MNIQVQITVIMGVPFDSMGGGVRVLTLKFFVFFFSVGVLFFFAESGVLFFKSELHVHFAGCHILLPVHYFWCNHGRFKQGWGWGDEKIQSQIQNFMV